MSLAGHPQLRLLIEFDNDAEGLEQKIELSTSGLPLIQVCQEFW